MSYKLTAGALFCAGMMAVSGSSGAATLSYSGSGPSIGLAQFDASMGTLNSVMLDYSGSATETQSLTVTTQCNNGNGNCMSRTASAAAAALVSVSGPDSFYASAEQTGSASCKTLAVRNNACTATATATALLSGTKMFTNLAEFIGTGNVNFIFGTGAGDTLLGSSVQLTYDYTAPPPPSVDPDGPVSPVPLPAGMPLLLAGLGALGWARRLRK